MDLERGNHLLTVSTNPLSSLHFTLTAYSDDTILRSIKRASVYWTAGNLFQVHSIFQCLGRKCRSHSLLSSLPSPISHVLITLSSFLSVSLVFLLSTKLRKGSLLTCSTSCLRVRPNVKMYRQVIMKIFATILGTFRAVSLFGAHGELTRAMNSYRTIGSKIALGLLRFPISLHASWCVQCSLLSILSSLLSPFPSFLLYARDEYSFDTKHDMYRFNSVFLMPLFAPFIPFNGG